MPARPVTIETLQLIAAVRDMLAEHLGADATVDERQLFGSHAFMVNGKLCLAVKGEDLLVRLPPSEHEAAAERPGNGKRTKFGKNIWHINFGFFTSNFYLIDNFVNHILIIKLKS